MSKRRKSEEADNDDEEYLTSRQRSDRRRKVRRRAKTPALTPDVVLAASSTGSGSASVYEPISISSQPGPSEEADELLEEISVPTDRDTDDEEFEEPQRASKHRRSRAAHIAAQTAIRRKRAILDSDSGSETDYIREPVIRIGDGVFFLGKGKDKFHYDIRCEYCGAKHFKSIFFKNNDDKVDPLDHVCCQHGKVFVPPMKDLPMEIWNLMKSKRNDFLTYNTAFSFASIQYHKIQAAPFGLPVAKSLGPVRHFTSAALPADPNNPRFGACYLYMGDDAVNLRMNNFRQLDREIVQSLQTVIETRHPFAHLMRTMGEILNECLMGDEEQDLVRLRIVDARQVNPEFLHGNHPGIYRTPQQYGDHVALFYSATVERDIHLPGLLIYPRRNDKTPMPIFPSDPRINCFCYPLLFVHGETGWKWGDLPLAEDPTVPFEERLKKFILKRPDIAVDWDIPVTAADLLQSGPPVVVPDHNPTDVSEDEEKDDDDADLLQSGPPVVVPVHNPTVVSEDDEEDDDEVDHLLHDMESYETVGDNQRVRFVERGGIMYPQDGSGTVNDATQHRTDLSGDQDDEELTAEQIEIEMIDALENEELPICPHDVVHVPNEEDVSIEDLDIGGQDDEDEPPRPAQFLDDEAVEESSTGDRLPVQHRKYCSIREWALYSYQDRSVIFHESDGISWEMPIKNRFLSGGKLTQLFLIDLATRMYQIRHSFQRKHHTDFVGISKSKFLKALQDRARRHNRTIGCVATVPHTVPGSPRDNQKLFERVVAMSRSTKGKPDLFITFTCNTSWPEIKDNIPPGETWAEHPMLVNEVFKKKYEKLLEIVIGKKYEKGGVARKRGMFGQVRWYSYSIEFQQRGPPHAHLVVSLMKHIKTADQINRVCQAVLPKLDGTEETKKLRKLVESFMIHRPCEDDPEAYCRVNCRSGKKECRKHFPKEFSETTRFGDRSYPELRRPQDNEFCNIGDKRADNRHVVAYNKELLSTFQAHCNVEVVSHLSVVKYIYKYIFKGYDRVLVEAITSLSAPDTAGMTIEGHLIFPNTLKIPEGAKKQREMQARKLLRDNGIDLKDANDNDVLVYDEYSFIEDQAALTSCEAAWDFQGYDRHGQSHEIVDLFVHGEDQEPLFYKKEEQAQVEERMERGEEIKTRFKAWFKLNQNDEEARSLTYLDLPTKYLFKNGEWRRKRCCRALLFGRIKSVHPRNKEVFAIRLLAMVVKGARSFEELRTVNGVIHPTFVSAAKAMGLMNDQDEWDRALEEASLERVPLTLRRMFATILVFNFVKNPLELWNKYKEHFFERRKWSDEQKEAHALYHINSFLESHLTNLDEFHLPAVNPRNLPKLSQLVDDSGTVDISILEAKKEYRKYSRNLNEEQQEVFDRVVQGVTDPEHTKAFFIQGSGGTGKTRVMNALYYYLTSKNYKVVSVAHTGYAARLLPYGSTAHRQFQIPLTTEEDMRCNVEQQSPHADYLEKVEVVLWDEATMTDRRILQAVHTLLADLHPAYEGRYFAGVKFVFSGDWKQTLPIVPETKGAGCVGYTMKGSDLWHRGIEVLNLTTNMRAIADPSFADWLGNVGVGRANLREDADKRPEDQRVKLDYGTIVDTEEELISAVFGDLSLPPEDNRIVFETTSILAVDNQSTFDVNAKVLARIPGEQRNYVSIDEHAQNRDFKYLDPEVYNKETPSGMPPHLLQLKKGAAAILLININTFLGLVNGTRVIISELGENVIWVEPVNRNKRCPERWPLTRSLFSPLNVRRQEHCFQRTQFPLRLCFSITCNRAQGQTLDRVGLLLRTPCFTHGQFYVAVSRVRRAADLFIYNSSMAKEIADKKKEQKQILEKEEKEHEQKRKTKESNRELRIKQLIKKTHKSRKEVLEMMGVHEEEEGTSAEPERAPVPNTPLISDDLAELKERRLYTNNVVYRNALH